MDAERVADVAMLACKGGNAIETGDIHGRDHETAHPSDARRRDHRVTVGVELGGIQMDVGIDQHDRTLAERAARLSTPSRSACACP
jgi:hypothetical protein